MTWLAASHAKARIYLKYRQTDKETDTPTEIGRDAHTKTRRQVKADKHKISVK